MADRTFNLKGALAEIDAIQARLTLLRTTFVDLATEHDALRKRTEKRAVAAADLVDDKLGARTSDLGQLAALIDKLGRIPKVAELKDAHARGECKYYAHFANRYGSFGAAVERAIGVECAKALFEARNARIKRKVVTYTPNAFGERVVYRDLGNGFTSDGIFIYTPTGEVMQQQQ